VLHVGFLLGLPFKPYDGGDMFLRNVGRFSVEYTELYSRDITLPNKCLFIYVYVMTLELHSVEL
jgi:hypothetical protein